MKLICMLLYGKTYKTVLNRWKRRQSRDAINNRLPMPTPKPMKTSIKPRCEMQSGNPTLAISFAPVVESAILPLKLENRNCEDFRW